MAWKQLQNYCDDKLLWRNTWVGSHWHLDLYHWTLLSSDTVSLLPTCHFLVLLSITPSIYVTVLVLHIWMLIARHRNLSLVIYYLACTLTKCRLPWRSRLFHVFSSSFHALSSQQSQCQDQQHLTLLSDAWQILLAIPKTFFFASLNDSSDDLTEEEVEPINPGVLILS